LFDRGVIFCVIYIFLFLVSYCSTTARNKNSFAVQLNSNNNCLDNRLTKLSALRPGRIPLPERLFFCFWYSLVLEAEGTPYAWGWQLEERWKMRLRSISAEWPTLYCQTLRLWAASSRSQYSNRWEPWAKSRSINHCEPRLLTRPASFANSFSPRDCQIGYHSDVREAQVATLTSLVAFVAELYVVFLSCSKIVPQ
jgi:hypothetical protein